jgi:hypothetical protein
MAPLSYYWLISFIYVVMAKIEIIAFQAINLTNRIVTRLDNSILV